MVNISSHDRFWMTPMRQIMPMMPKDSKERFFASSSMLSCRGVRFSSTCFKRLTTYSSVTTRIAYLLHHREDHTELRLGPSCNNDAGAPTWRMYESYSTLTESPNLPLRTKVPMYAMHERSANATASAGAMCPLLWPFA